MKTSAYVIEQVAIATELDEMAYSCYLFLPIRLVESEPDKNV